MPLALVWVLHLTLAGLAPPAPQHLLSPSAVPPTVTAEPAVKTSAPADSTYGAWLTSHLADTYGVGEGTWLLTTAMDQLLEQTEVVGEQHGLTVRLDSTTAPINASRDTTAVPPFSHYLDLEVPSVDVMPYKVSVDYEIPAEVAEGSTVLLAFWARALAGETEGVFITAVFEQNHSPYEKALRQDILPASAWQLYLVPFQVTSRHRAGRSQLKFFLGYQRQHVQLGGIALIDYGADAEVEDLPNTGRQTAYAGMGLGAAWRAEAESRIRAIRQGVIDVTVLDRSGQPVPAEVFITMERHAFDWGSAIRRHPFTTWGYNKPEYVTYRDKLLNLGGPGRGFNMVTFESELKWHEWEAHPERREDVFRGLDFLEAHGINVRGHTLVWPHKARIPSDVKDNKSRAAYVSSRLFEDAVRGMAGHPRLKGRILEWDVLNEVSHHPFYEEVFGNTAIYADLIDSVRVVDPEAKIFINEYDIMRSAGRHVTMQREVLELFRTIEANGAAIDGLGIQGHMRTVVTPPAAVIRVLDTFAELGVDLRITEYDTRGVDHELAGSYMRDFLTAIFSHPAVTGMVLWGFWDGNHTVSDAPLFYEDWTLKPAGEAYIDLVFNQWWTDFHGFAAGDGRAVVEAFYGDYAITVVHGAQMETVAYTHAPGGAPLTIKVGEGLVSTSTASSSGASLLQPGPLVSYPSPTTTDFTVALPVPLAREITTTRWAAARPVIEVFNSVGQRVYRAYLHMESTHHAVNAGAWPSGVYFIRIHGAGQQWRTTQLITR